MELIEHLQLGFSTALTPVNLVYCFFGVLLGTAIGVLPGVGPLATIALLLPFTFSLSPVGSLIMLAGIYYGAQYGGSTTAILINLPGEASSAVTAVDGYQMAQQGRAGVALATAAIGSFFAGTVATVLIAIFAIPLTKMALNFGPVEYFSLIALGLVASVAIARGSIIKALAMILVGVLIGTVGTDIQTGVMRYNFGLLEISDGVDLVSVAVGIFGIAEILRNLEDERVRSAMASQVKSLMPTREDFRRMIGPILRGTGIGSLLGVLPGGGAMLSSFASYTLERRIASRSSEFGNGAIEGVAGPESANNAGAQTSFIPMLALGIPANSVMALIVGAMILHGITPGPDVMVRQPALVWGLIASMWIGNLMLIILNLPLVGLWVKLLTVPYNVLVPVIVVCSAIGVYSVGTSAVAVYTITVAGAFGYLCLKLDCEPAPLLMGFVLGPLLETHLRRALLMSRGDVTVFVTQPISAVLLALALVALVLALMPKLQRKRDEVFAED